MPHQGVNLRVKAETAVSSRRVTSASTDQGFFITSPHQVGSEPGTIRMMPAYWRFRCPPNTPMASGGVLPTR